MDIIDWDSEQLPPHVAHFLRQKVEDRATKALERSNMNDILDELEAGQNLGAFPISYPCNTTK